ncbi:delta-60 repeat domain-containing protein [Actinopolyspora mzabensis]|uniref:delta-60 repeat domain-containing protein n=1 Tax=Actinopolyspora mzabensis TaxID=995066 RepID=UPI001C408CF5|nr:delta-60 repeat domain-containing protein [Actinopolyspora mzabensis]
MSSPAPAFAATSVESAPSPVTAGVMPTPQTNGTIFTVEIVGDTAYAGGMFTTARPAGVAPGGAGEVARHNLLAFDLDTGDLLPWSPEVSNSHTVTTAPGSFCRELSPLEWTCDTVFQLESSPDGSRLYAAGDFDRVDGQWRSRLARFDTATGELDPDFAPAPPAGYAGCRSPARPSTSAARSTPSTAPRGNGWRR